MHQRFTTATVGSTSPATVQGVDLWQLTLAPGMLGDGSFLFLGEDMRQHWTYSYVEDGLFAGRGLFRCSCGAIHTFSLQRIQG